VIVVAPLSGGTLLHRQSLLQRVFYDCHDLISGRRHYQTAIASRLERFRTAPAFPQRCRDDDAYIRDP
jgi:hypothetical protein